jgi:hypothetical protein
LRESVENFNPSAPFFARLFVSSILSGRKPHFVDLPNVFPLILRADMPENVHALSDPSQTKGNFGILGAKQTPKNYLSL